MIWITRSTTVHRCSLLPALAVVGHDVKFQRRWRTNTRDTVNTRTPNRVILVVLLLIERVFFT